MRALRVGMTQSEAVGDALEDEGLGFADAHAAHGETVQAVLLHGGELAGAVGAEVGVFGALDDAEIELALGAFLLQADAGPAEGLLNALGGVVVGRGVGDALIEEHRDVAAQGALDGHALLGAHEEAAAPWGP